MKTGYLDLTYDAPFKRFMKAPKILVAILNDLLPMEEDKIVNITFSDTTVAPPEDAKSVVFDLVAATSRGETVNVEMQKAHRRHFIKRLMAYKSRIHSTNLKKGESYGNQSRFVSIVFTQFDLNEKKEAFGKRLANKGVRYFFPQEATKRDVAALLSKKPSCYKAQGPRGSALPLEEVCIFIDLRCFEALDPNADLDSLSSICYIIQNSRRLGPQEIQALKKKGGTLKDPVEEFEFLSAQESLKRTQFKQRLEQEAIKVEMQEIREEGRKEGRQEGRKEGRQEGRKEGRQEGLEVVAIGLLKEGFDVEFVCRHSGLSSQQVLSLKKSLSS